MRRNQMATKACNTCMNYDPIIRGKGKLGKHGRCIPQSVYPAVEQRGQAFPEGCQRAESGELARPHIVTGAEVVPSCNLYKERK